MNGYQSCGCIGETKHVPITAGLFYGDERIPRIIRPCCLAGDERKSSADVAWHFTWRAVAECILIIVRRGRDLPKATEGGSAGGRVDPITIRMKEERG